MSNKTVLKAAIIAALATAGTATADNLTRIATVPVGAEITGMFITEAGDLFFNVQHPGDANPAPFNKAAVGVVKGADFNALPAKVPALDVPAGEAKGKVLTSVGEYQTLVLEGDKIGADVTGQIVAINGDVIKQSNDPDFNAFVPTNADSSAGYLFTAWEDRPGGEL